MKAQKLPVIVICGLLGGCGGAVDPGAHAGVVADEHADMVSSTVVWVQDGKIQTATEWLTHEEMHRQIVQREEEIANGTLPAAAATRQAPQPGQIKVEWVVVPSCYDSSAWLFDAANLGGNRICLDGTGGDDLLADIGWTALTRSYWGGGLYGFFSEVSNGQGINCEMDPWRKMTEVYPGGPVWESQYFDLAGDNSIGAPACN